MSETVLIMAQKWWNNKKQNNVLQGEKGSEKEATTVPVKARPRPSMGLGYLLEDAQWLEEEEVMSKV